jgi:hypothetical protein
MQHNHEMSRWYMLADANGLRADDKLVANQVLQVPNQVANAHHDSHTARPYSQSEALGEPALPCPIRHHRPVRMGAVRRRSS